MKFCPECGAKLITQKFCQECGANISKYLGNKGSSESSESLAGFDFSALENEASKQLKEQERLEKIKKDFEIENGVLIKYKGKGGKVVVPKSVTVVGAKAFSQAWSIRSEITEVSFEGNITEIGEAAFEGCYNMTSIALPDSLRIIGESAFCGAGMESVALPRGLELLGSSAFSHARLTSITVPGGVIFDDQHRGYVFYCCENLRSVTIENGVKSIPPHMFSGCRALESITIPHSVTNIEGCAFYNCTRLRSITIPHGVTNIEGCAFYKCTSLTGATLPDTIASIGSLAFASCSSLTSITVPKDVTFLADDAFTDCVALERIQYNATSLNMIGRGTRGSFSFSAFLGAKNDTSSNEVRYSGFQNNAFQNAGSERGGITVTIGANVLRVPDGLFHAENCKITGIVFESGSNCQIIGAYAFYNCQMVRSIEIPRSVVEIGAYAFFKCSSVTHFELPSRVNKIGESAFSCCESLVSITMPSYLTEIANDTFNSCKNLESITIPNGVTRIGECAFLGCDSISLLEIPYSVKEIEHYALKIKNRLTLKLPRHLSWQFFKEEYEFNRDDWKLIEY